MIITFGWSLLRAPYEQRDDARRRAAELQTELVEERKPPPAPSLRLADRLEADSSPARCFRLRIWNDSATGTRPIVEVVQLTEQNGSSLLDVSQLPLELEWTHHPEGPPILTSQDNLGQSVAVLGLNQPPNAAEVELYVYGRRHQPGVGRVHDQLRGNIYVTVAARAPNYPDLQPITRKFVLRRDTAAPLLYAV